MISRRALFGLTAGAAASAVVPVQSDHVTAEAAQFVMGMDFGKRPAMTAYRYYWDGDFMHMERVDLRELEVDIKWDKADILPDIKSRKSA